MTAYPIIITFDNSGNVTAMTGFGTLMYGDSACLNSGEGVIHIINASGNELKMVGNMMGMTMMTGDYGGDITTIPIGAPGTFSLILQ